MRLIRPAACSPPSTADVGAAVVDVLDPGAPAHTDSTNEEADDAMPISLPWKGRRLPTNRMRTNDTAGISGDDPGVFQEPLEPISPSSVDVVDVDAAAVAVEHQDDGEADADLGGRDGDDEQGEDLARPTLSRSWRRRRRG